jgi:hypothetical protein
MKFRAPFYVDRKLFQLRESNPGYRRERLIRGVVVSAAKAFKPSVLGYLSNFPRVVSGTFCYPFLPFFTENVPDLSPI